MICPECGGKAVSRVEGSSLVIECQECDWSIATSYIDPIYEDESIYAVFLREGNAVTKELLKIVSIATGGNFIAAKKAIGNPDGPISQGKAPEVKEVIASLSDAGALFEVVPPYPY